MRGFLGSVTGLAAWILIATVAGVVMRLTWPAYAGVARAMTFTLSMMIARLSIGALATVVMGFVAAAITRSMVATLVPGVLLLIAFVPQHVVLWDKFPVWYHLTFLLSLIPLTYLGGRIASRGVIPSATAR